MRVRFTAVRWVAAATMLAGLVVAFVVGTAVAANPLTINAVASTQGDVTSIDLSFTNNTLEQVPNLEIIVPLPPGSTVVAAAPQLEIVDGSLRWYNSPGVPPGQTLAGFQFRLRDARGTTSVIVNFIGSTRGSVTSGPIDFGS